MPQHKSAIKRARQNEVRNLRNRVRKSKMRTFSKAVLTSTDKAQAEIALKTAVAYIDKMSLKGIIHKNKAARDKSRLTRFVNAL